VSHTECSYSSSGQDCDISPTEWGIFIASEGFNTLGQWFSD